MSAVATGTLVWNDGDINGTSLLGYLDLPKGLTFEAGVAKLVALGAVDEGPGDKTTHEFRGTFDGATFTLYDYYGDAAFHIGGHGALDWWDAPALDLAAFKAHLEPLLAS